MEIDGVFYRIADTVSEKKEALNLIKSNYLKSGLINNKSKNNHISQWHYMTVSTVFIAVKSEKIIATLTLIEDGFVGIPIEHTFANEIYKLRKNAKIAEISHFAQHCECLLKGYSFKVFIQLVRIMFQYSVFKGVQRFVIATHPKHFKLYTKFLEFTQVGQEKKYDLVCDNPAIAGYHNIHPLDLQRIKIFKRVKDVNFGYKNNKREDYWCIS